MAMSWRYGANPDNGLGFERLRVTRLANPSRPAPGVAFDTLMIALAAVGFGVVPFFAKSLADAGMPAQAVAFSRFMLAAVAFAPFLKLGRAGRSTTAWGILAGAVMAFGWIGYVEALKTVPVAVVGVLYMTYPVFTLAIAWVWFRDRPAGRSILAAGLILAAAALAMSPASVGGASFPVLLFALAAPIGFGVAINILTNKLIHVPPVSRLACVSLGAALGLAPLMAGEDVGAMVSLAITHWWLVAGITLVTALIPQLLYSIYAPRIGAAKSAMAGSVELPTMFVIGWLAFGENIGFVHLLTAGIVLIAIMITPPRRSRGQSS
jgi:drug/metabolite transporter (DMT)-like permease